MQQVYKSLPDDNPITAICIVEEIAKCPPGFYPVSKTHDQDSDADLWKEVTFFGRRISRYLCISKTVGIISNYIVENVGVIGEKDIPPDGYSLIPRTIDGDSKAWRKRQVCYSLTRRTHATTAVTDIILLSKYKKALPGFSLAGDINGLTLCYKTSNHIPPLNGPVSLGYPLSPPTNGSDENSTSRSEISNGVYPNLGKSTESPSDEYVNLIRPIRPAPQVPAQPPNNYVPSTYGTLSNYQGLEGIPFILNPKFKSSTDIMMQLPAVKVKTEAQLDHEYSYDFRLERQT